MMKPARTHSNNRAFLVLVVEDDGHVIGDLAGSTITAGALRAVWLVKAVEPSNGSVRDQILHLMNMDDVWFSELQGVEPLEPAPAA